VDTIARGLTVPWDVAFLPDGRALVSERPGRIRLVSARGTLDPEPWAHLEVYAHEEVGLMGMDVGRSASGRLYLYVAATYREVPRDSWARRAAGAWRRLVRTFDAERGHPTTLRVLRIPVTGERAGPAEVVVEGLPAFMLHGGGALRFGPDGLLYVSNGDATEPSTAHDPRSARGKILRFNPEGEPAPVRDGSLSPVFARGIRHVQGMDWDPETGQMFAIDHGPSGMAQEGYRGHRDELNAVGPGDHLGWPVVTGTTRGGPFTSALLQWTPAIAPAGMELYDGSVGEWAGSVFVTGLRGETLRRLRVSAGGEGRWRVDCQETVIERDYGRLRLVRTAPDGSLWVGTSNGDGRGVPGPQGDLIVRLRPARAGAGVSGEPGRR